MIRITNTSLIIEIPCINEVPLEKLSHMQQGLLNLFGCIDLDEPQAEVQNGLWHLRNLLKEMMLNENQAGKINELAKKNPSILGKAA